MCSSFHYNPVADINWDDKNTPELGIVFCKCADERINLSPNSSACIYNASIVKVCAGLNIVFAFVLGIFEKYCVVHGYCDLSLVNHFQLIVTVE